MTTALQLGSAQQAQQAVSIGGSAVTSVLPIVTHVAWAVPVVGAAIAGVAIALSLIFNGKGPQQKTAATKIWEEQVLPLLKQNLANFQSAPQTAVNQQAALKNFDDAWAWLKSEQGCGNPELGDPGRRCVSERDRGGIYDCFTAFRDPIAAAAVSSDPVENFIQTVAPGLSMTTGSTMLLGAALLLGGLWI